MATFQQCFSGKVVRADYFQPVAAIKWRNVISTDAAGNPTSWAEGYDVFQAKVVDESFRFEGLTYGQAHTTETQNVTDVDGNSHDVPFDSVLIAPTYDELSWEKRSVTVQRMRMSPHMWEVVVHVRNATLYVNGAVSPNQG